MAFWELPCTERRSDDRPRCEISPLQRPSLELLFQAVSNGFWKLTLSKSNRLFQLVFRNVFNGVVRNLLARLHLDSGKLLLVLYAVATTYVSFREECKGE